jgi:ribonuclease HI
MNDYKSWFDGSCGPLNPGGTATSGAIVKDKDGTFLLKERRLVGKGEGMSNNVAEYAAIIRVFEHLLPRSPGHVVVQGDSRLVIKQLNGRWRIREGLYRAAALEAQQMLGHLRCLGWKVDLQWIPREQNKDCDALSKGQLLEAGHQEEFNSPK